MINRLTIGVISTAYFSAFSFAIVFGVISPKISTTTVITIVLTVAPRSLLSPKIPVKNSVAMDVEAIFTMLLPMRIVDKTMSKSSASSIVRCIRRVCPMAFSLTLLSEENAVSADEKNAESNTSIIITISSVLFIFPPNYIHNFQYCF